MRQSDESYSSPLQHLLDVWFSPKRFESQALYERLGVLFIKRYVPTGGAMFFRSFRSIICQISGKTASIIPFCGFTFIFSRTHLSGFVRLSSFLPERVNF